METKGQLGLVLFHRNTARMMAKKLMKQWGATLDFEEVESLSDLALCEAAKGFDRRHNAKFTTYLFYFIRGALIRAIKQNAEHSQVYELVDYTPREGQQDGDDQGSSDHQFESFRSCPEREAWRRQVVQHCSRALSKLSKLERQVVLEVNVAEVKVAALARKLGYSRGYLSDVKSIAHRKLRPELEHLKQAA